jgi:hypothetical protein
MDSPWKNHRLARRLKTNGLVSTEEGNHPRGEKDMGAYDGQMGSEFGELGESGEFGEFGEMGEFESGEFGEFGEMGEGPEAHEQFLGDVLGSVLGGEVAPPLSEAQEIELASELLGINNEQELEQFLGGLFNKVAKGIGGFIKSPVGRALGGILKGVAKKALPVVGGALGSMVVPGIGTALGSKLGSMASGLFEFEFEALPAEQAEFEVARRYVRLASSAARHAALAQPRVAVSPLRIARAAVARAARTEAPGLYKQMIRTLASTAAPAIARGGARMAPRPGVVTPAATVSPAATAVHPAAAAAAKRPIPPRPQRFYRGYPYVYGYTPDGWDAASAQAADYTGVADGWPEPSLGIRTQGAPLSGRWVRRGRKIIVIGV